MCTNCPPEIDQFVPVQLFAPLKSLSATFVISSDHTETSFVAVNIELPPQPPVEAMVKDG